MELKASTAAGRTKIQYNYFDGLVQERHNSSALAMELHLSCTNPSIWTCLHSLDWKTQVTMMPTLSLVVAPDVVAMTTSGAASDNKDGIMMSLSF